MRHGNCTAPAVCITLEDSQIFWCLSMLVGVCALSTLCKLCARSPALHHATRASRALETPETSSDESIAGREAAAEGKGMEEGREMGMQHPAEAKPPDNEDQYDPPPYHRLV